MEQPGEDTETVDKPRSRTNGDRSLIRREPVDAVTSDGSGAIPTWARGYDVEIRAENHLGVGSRDELRAHFRELTDTFRTTLLPPALDKSSPMKESGPTA